MEEVRLYYSSAVEEPWCDLKKVRNLLKKLEEKGVSVEEINVAVMTPTEIKELYNSSIVHASIIRKYKISGIFGTRRDAGRFFGREQPSLAVFEEDEKEAKDVYPHDENGRRVTIADYLSERLAGLEEES